MSELRTELERKNNLIQRHNERLQQWQTMLSRGPTAAAAPAGGGSPAPAAAASNAAAAQPAAAGAPPPGPSQPMAAAAGIPAAMPPGLSQGPLAFLEQKTSNIGTLPRGMTGS